MNTSMNSRESVMEALNWDIDCVEVDIRFDQDGNPILTHDPVADPKFCISLKEALDIIAIKTNVSIALDLKEWNSLSELVSVIDNSGFSQRAMYLGNVIDDMPRLLKEGGGFHFFPNVYREMVENEDAASLAILASRYKSSGAKGIGINYHYLSREAVNQFHAAGLLVSAWTVDDRKAMERMLEYGIDYVTTNRPDILREVLS
jgi:glycerophosphoryl diester phosphodiesterase